MPQPVAIRADGQCQTPMASRQSIEVSIPFLTRGTFRQETPPRFGEERRRTFSFWGSIGMIKAEIEQFISSLARLGVVQTW